MLPRLHVLVRVPERESALLQQRRRDGVEHEAVAHALEHVLRLDLQVLLAGVERLPLLDDALLEP